ncbi:Protein of unknown function [Cotesia congregata]|uniref:Uncharacterized protein n=1 Tax=Cotesia congregata TaxID=51543 RepID=A0A8J2MFH1_COTCN|nr:Protein of unknown function [Cotesia congregata]
MLNHIQKNINNCVPLLGEYCLKNGECGTENSFCLNNECRCKDSFYEYSKKQCLPKIIGKECQEDTDCREIKFAECSKRKVCVCAKNTVALSPGLCYPLLNEACQVDEDCKVDYSICIENVCKCKPKHFSSSIGNCTQMYLGMPCKYDLQCRIYMDKTKCSPDKVCTCEYNHFQRKDGFCKPEWERSCLNDELCNDENSICVDDKCQCKPQFKVQGSKCIPGII